MKERAWDYLKRGEFPPGWGFCGSQTLVVHPDWREAFREKGWETVRAIVVSSEGEVVTEDRKREKNVVKKLRWELKGGTQVVYLKHYYNLKFEKIRKRAFRGSWWPPSMVCREYRNLLFLEQIGIPAPRPMAYGEIRLAGGLIHAVLLTAEVPQAVGLDYFLGTWLPNQTPERRREVKREVLGHLADVTRRMHEARFEHHDYFLRNIMVSASDFSRLYLLDAPRGRRWPGWLAGWFGRHDLATLDAAATRLFSRTDRLRFFLRYRAHDRLTAADKRMIRAVLRKADPWRERQTRRLEASVPGEVPS